MLNFMIIYDAVFRMNPFSSNLGTPNMTNAYQIVTACISGQACSCPSTNSNSLLAFNSTIYTSFLPARYSTNLLTPFVMAANVSSALQGFQSAETRPYFPASQAAPTSSSINVNVSAFITNSLATRDPGIFGPILLPAAAASQSSSTPGMHCNLIAEYETRPTLKWSTQS